MKKRAFVFALALTMLLVLLVPGTMAAEIGAPSTDDANISEGSDLIVDDTTTPPTAPADPGVPAVLSDLDIPCTTCGAVGCTVTHVWCDTCQKNDCGITHLWCDICQKNDCGLTHVWCDICQKNDCGITHESAPQPTPCPVCSLTGCAVSHVWCDSCAKYDCGLTHEPSPEPTPCPTCGVVGCTETHETGTETPPEQESLFDKLMEAEDMKSFEELAIASNGEYYDLTCEEIEKLHGKVNELYEAIEEPTEDDEAKRAELCALLLELPNAPEYCEECGGFNAHLDGCSMLPPVDEPPVDEPPVDEPPVDEPPVDEPPVDEPPVEEPPQCSCGTNTDVHTEGCPLYASLSVSFIAYYDGQETGCVELLTAPGLLTLPDGSAEEFTGFARDGKTIFCWSEMAGEINENNTPGSSIPVSGDMELFAVWVDSEYPIGIDPMGGAFAEAVPLSYTVGLQPLLPTPEKDGWVFEGWDVSGEGNWSAAFSPSAPDFAGKYGPVQLTARWKEADVTINYLAADGGTVTLSTETLPRESGVAGGSVATAHEYYRFAGWYDSLGQLVSTEASFVPGKKLLGYSPLADGEEQAQPCLAFVAETYTAKFERIKTALTIYTDSPGVVLSVSGAGRNTVVAVDETGSVRISGLPAGEVYTVVPIACDWHSVVSPQSTEFILEEDSTMNAVSFSVSQINNQWLSDNSTYTG